MSEIPSIRRHVLTVEITFDGVDFYTIFNFDREREKWEIVKACMRALKFAAEYNLTRSDLCPARPPAIKE